jgi:hypothetical protein
MPIAYGRACFGFAVIGLLVLASEVNADTIQSYTATNSTTPQTATLNSADTSQSGGNFPATYSDNNMSASGQTVVIPTVASGGSVAASYNNIEFSFYTAGSYSNPSGAPGGLPIPVAYAGTTLYVFKSAGNPQVTAGAGPYTGSPTGLSAASFYAASTGIDTTFDPFGTTGSAYKFAPGFQLDAGNTYTFYIGYSTAPTFEFDVAGVSSIPYESSGLPTNSVTGPWNGDQRYRTDSSGNYMGPTNSMMLFTVTGSVVPEPSRVVALMGLASMGLASMVLVGLVRRRRQSTSVCKM